MAELFFLRTHCLHIWCVMKRKFKHCSSTIPPISTTRTVTSHLNSRGGKQGTTIFEDENPGPCDVLKHDGESRIRMTLLWPGLVTLIQRQTSQLMHCMLWFVLALFYLRGISSRTWSVQLFEVHLWLISWRTKNNIDEIIKMDFKIFEFKIWYKSRKNLESVGCFLETYRTTGRRTMEITWNKWIPTL
jgi:hypothetical protein